ncbi:hypothetical protein HN51_037900 [Arachis hypogaea]|uniref:peptidylprolyl isomerase n=1 Tax=Arachis hypogaea TaxID=3818 RepID=A0A444ZTZ8_ARAHY|nr:peptidyl-prolyl cis-trans isomerase FKBP17-2, chloroplastic [Arachis hypogaea]QHO03526.1 Peptidyl-prolyl cis-trans isomerase FKBP17-2 [Arachis hypogaea]RYR17701.1 hypothetical protein Ahy_B03g062397 [Arachis hypogaea]
MATFFNFPPVFSALPSRTHHHIHSSQTPPPPPPSQPSSTTGNDNQEILQVSTKSQQQKPIKPTKIESTDWIATSLTRRFGLGAGLAWVGFLAFGVISEQIKTRFEVSQQQANTRTVDKEQGVLLPNGIRYTELKVGGGASPKPGDLVVIDIVGRMEDSGQVFVDTTEKKPLALVMGSRPYSKGVCEGIEYVLRTMKAGGKRRVIVPPSLGFGESGADFGTTEIPPLATLDYIVEVERVSIAPA